MKRFGLFVALSLATGGSIQAQGKVAHVGIGGWGIAAGYDITLVAVQAYPSVVVGHAHLHGGATGIVTQMVKPASPTLFWCISVLRLDVGGNGRINFYIRQQGDGNTSFDQISFVSTTGKDCTALPTPPGQVFSLTAGDFKLY